MIGIPIFSNNTVEATYYYDTTRIYITGKDDFAMELEESGWDILMFNAFCKSPVSINRCKKLGFIYS